MTSEEIQNAFGVRLTEAMKEKKLTAYKLWKITGLSQSVIGATMKGKQNSRLDTIAILSDGLGVKPGYFFVGM